MTDKARLYGGSMYDLAAEESRSEAILDQMTMIRDLFRENPDYTALLQEPSIALEERLGLIDQAFSRDCDRYLVNFIKLLCERNLLNEFASCTEEYIHRYHADHNISEAHVSSAVPLTEEQKKALTAKLEGMSGHTVYLTASVDPTLLAGVRVELDGCELDGTVKGRMAAVSRRLNETIV